MQKLIYIVLGLIIGATALTVSAQVRTFTSLQLASDPDNSECLTTDGTHNSWGSCGSGSGDPFAWTPTSWGVSTSTTLGFLNGFLSTASSTIDSNLLITGNSTTTHATTTSLFSTTLASDTLRVTGLTSALTLTGSTGVFAEYTGTTCTNQFIRVLSALGAATCATVGTADVAGLDISDDTNLAVTSPITLTGDTVGFDFSTSNTWTGANIFDSITRSTTTNATTTNLGITSLLTFNGVTGDEWTDFCTTITGGAGLCDGSDDGGAGTSAFEIATTSDIAVPNLAYFTKTSGRTTLGSVATGTVSGTGGITVTASRYAVGGALAIDCTVSSGSADGCLSSADWTTFNNKQNTISATWPITLTGAAVGFNGLSTSSAAVTGNVPYFSGVNTFANVATSSLVQSTGINIANGTTAYVLGAQPTFTIDQSFTPTWTGAHIFNNITRSTTTSATSTSFFTTTASTTNFFGADLATCNATTGKLTWSAGKFGCGTDTDTGAPDSKWATTTNLVGIYPNGGATTGVVIGGTATTVNAFLQVIGTTTSNTLSAGTTAIGSNVAKISPLTGLTVSGSESVGGLLNVTTLTTDSIGAVFYNNHTGSSRLVSLVCDAATYSGNCLHVRSDGTATALNVAGAPTGQGLIKAGSNGVGDSDAAILSLDASTSGFLGQTMFMKCGTNSTCWNLRDANNNQTLTVSATGRYGWGTTTPQWQVQVASSTGAQLTLSDSNSITNNHWSFRNAGGLFYLATSSPSTFATSSSFAFGLNANGFPIFPKLVSCNTVDTDANGLLSCGTDDGGSGAPDTHWATSTGPFVNSIFPNSGNDNTLVGIGTSTPAHTLTVSSSTRPQLSLTDSSLTSNQWTFRNAGGLFYLATSSPSTFATSSAFSLRLNANGMLSLMATTSRPLKITSAGDVIGATTTRSVSLFKGASLTPDTGGNSWFQPYSITAANDVMLYNVGVASSTSAKTGFYGQAYIPADFNGGCSVTVLWTSPLTTGDVVYDFAYRGIGGDDAESLDQATFVETITATDSAPSAVDERNKVTLPLTCSNLAADDTLQFYISRDGADAADTLASDAVIHDVLFNYSN